MDLKLEDIPDKFHILIDIIGIDKFIEILKVYGGDSLYIPTYKSIIKIKRNEEIKTKFNGFNIREIAREYDISISHIKRILEG